MAKTIDALSARGALVEAARVFYQRGWMYGTAGNLSARILSTRPHDSHDSFWITASGLPKGHLEESDFIRIDTASGNIVEQPDKHQKPSAEAHIHQVIYRHHPEARACFHVHSVDAVLAAEKRANMQTGQLPLPPLEMVKGLGIWDEEQTTFIPVFNNHSDVTAIASDIETLFSESPNHPVPAVLIHRHGATVWGRSIQETFNRVEIIEFLMSYLANSQ